VTRLWTVRARHFLFSNTFIPPLGSTELRPGVKQPRNEVNHSSPSSAKVKNEWSYTSAPPVYVQGVDRENSAFMCSGQLNVDS
jgi:hypothetical protein